MYIFEETKNGIYLQETEAVIFKHVSKSNQFLFENSFNNKNVNRTRGKELLVIKIYRLNLYPHLLFSKFLKIPTIKLYKLLKQLTPRKKYI